MSVSRTRDVRMRIGPALLASYTSSSLAVARRRALSRTVRPARAARRPRGRPPARARGPKNRRRRHAPGASC